MDTTRPSLLLRIRDPSDGAAWRTFDAIYRPMLCRFARARGLTHEDAEDVAQQCLGAIADKIAEFDYDPGKGRFKGWLRTLVNNRVRNLLRARQAKPTAGGDAVQQADTQPDAASPDEIFEQLWLQEHLWHCLRELRTEVEEKTYQAYEAYVIDERPLSRVCEEFGLTPNNVYTLKWRLTQRVAAKMKELLDGLD